MTRTRHALRCRAVWAATVLVVAVLLVAAVGSLSAGPSAADPPNMMPLPPPVAGAIDRAAPPPAYR